MTNVLIQKERLPQIGFWGCFWALLAVCSYFLIHNAWWIIGDEAIVVSHTGMGIPFSPTGFDVMPSEGRLYPFAYNLYNVLLLFGSGYISPQAHYILQAIALIVYAFFFALIGINILKDKPAIWKYSITFCLVAIAVVRVLPEFITCYTGAWIIFMFLPVFLYCAIRFEETERWGFGIIALLTINYITYCYETVCTIPFAMGVCALLFNYKHLSRNKKIFNVLLIVGVLIFLGIWIFAILPQATHFYSHKEEASHLINALKIFIAQKIYWLAAIALIYRVVQIISKKSAYCFYDSLLLASFACFLGTAILKLNFTYYYNIGSLVALVAVLYFAKENLKPYWVCILFVALTLFYGRKYPSVISKAQKDRVTSQTQITQLSETSKTAPIYWFAPYFEDQEVLWADVRNCQRGRLETIMHWYMQNDEVTIVEKEEFDSALKGVWLFPSENEKLFPDMEQPTDIGEKVLDTGGVKGYMVQ